MFTVETLINAGKTFLMLFGELFALFIGISFVVALLQIYISQDRIKRILTTPRKGLNSVLGASTWCSYSVLFLFHHPCAGRFVQERCAVLWRNLFPADLSDSEPAIITLMLAFFGIKATIVYTVFTFLFAVIMGTRSGCCRV